MRRNDINTTRGEGVNVKKCICWCLSIIADLQFKKLYVELIALVKIDLSMQQPATGRRRRRYNWRRQHSFVFPKQPGAQTSFLTSTNISFPGVKVAKVWSRTIPPLSTSRSSTPPLPPRHSTTGGPPIIMSEVTSSGSLFWRGMLHRLAVMLDPWRDGTERLSRNVGKYQPTPHNMSEERRSHSECG